MLVGTVPEKRKKKYVEGKKNFRERTLKLKKNFGIRGVTVRG